ncbi:MULTISPECIES: 1-deoxy-D-xylulose-5-phosphate reductoisomerase [unclassified Treponema]|uniref:1-deoxy-D-xylulose-5-phosphate reductoisomerase n=1 Tax=unclassified Treponema TaxID=2638727 RepID=UPI0020A6194F|nr:MULTISPECIES: 1-deoxy-D-xylulose-5-phosphate reductoisomerase [unclassified Treponema]UTC67481.1 1-deoxy-D-xylulose-5-phosphate reductoisomerase [Treponema sp. OMZ 789]UTC70209.1 1-deoxy-D-xylulose-5-phosphate reductoisomerase [Treponema sp. OMZ 790]UTC72924.1 1-deoxy-D-xylulose-5-phosphate reductoisomerase [Treponema sp. OMZ 791]
MKKKRVLVLGAGGSIGKNSLEVIRRFPDRFELAGFSVHSNLDFAQKMQAEFTNAQFVSTKKTDSKLKHEIDVEAVRQLIEKSRADIVINGIAGSAGLKASAEVIKSGLDLGLANKETIVEAGELIFKDAEKSGSTIIPVDSEHAAIFQLINAHKKENIEKIIITASGGPFLNTPKEKLGAMKLEDALKHPTWKMGGKITIDSASLANKALEVIEAVKLFSFPPEKIEVTVHPQSIIHSMVQCKNGEIFAQASPPDMKNPILNALSFPKMPESFLRPLDFSQIINLEFMPPRTDDFPMLVLGFEAAGKGGAYPIAFNVANEEAVDAFIKGKIGFTDLADITQEVLNSDWTMKPSSYEEVYDYENRARAIALARILDRANGLQ